MIFMRRCPKCKKENYALNVAAGICTWCGYEAKKEDCKNNKDVWEVDKNG